MTPLTSAERVRFALDAIGAAPGSEDPENCPAPDSPWSPWAVPVMLFAGGAHDGTPWLWLACRCGWHLGFSEQIDPDHLAEAAKTHRDECEVAQELLAAKPESAAATHKNAAKRIRDVIADALAGGEVPSS